MRIETAGQKISRSLGEILGAIGSLLNRAKIAQRDQLEARQAAKVRAEGPTVEERQAELVDFYSKYEDLVEVLCDAAQYGPVQRLETRYLQLRRWMHGNYPEVRPFLVTYLRFSHEDAEDGLTISGRGTDAFEALVLAESLHDFLQMDDGTTISRITRTREALNLYAEHLRQLAARTG